MKRTAALMMLALILTPAGFAAAEDKDIYLEENMETVAPSGQTPLNGLVKTWIKGDKLRKESFGRDVAIFRPDKGVMWMLHSQSKTYAEIPMDQIRALTEKSLEIYKPSRSTAVGGAEQWFVKTGKTDKVGKWNCYEIELTAHQVLGPGVTSRTTQCVSKETGLDSRTLIRMFDISMGNKTTPETEKLFGVIKTLDGYPVRQVTTTEAQGQTVTTTLTLKKVEMKPIDDALFEAPFGYTKINPPSAPPMR